MSKNRFTTSDVQAMVRDIRSHAMGQRVANIYDLSEKCYLFKFAIPGKSTKTNLLLESGIRFHTTKYSRDLPELPSAFSMKLRKYIRTKRLEDVKQIGIDRVVDFKFGSGEAVNHVILELYANGNIVLTDGNYEVLALLRSHQFEEDVKLKVGELYPMAFSTTGNNYTATTTGGGGNTGTTTEDVNNFTLSNITPMSNILAMTVDEFKQWAAQKLAEFKEFHAHEELIRLNAQAKALELAQKSISETINPTNTASNSIVLSDKVRNKAERKAIAAQLAAQSSNIPKNKKIREMTLKQLLLNKESGVSICGPEVLDHCLLLANIKPNMRVEAVCSSLSDEAISLMMCELMQAERVTAELNTPGLPGYIIYKDNSNATSNNMNSSLEKSDTTSTTTGTSFEYIEFLPMLFTQHIGCKYLVFPSFDQAVDEYYCKIEEQKLQKEAISAELTAKKKIDKIQRDHEKAKNALILQQERMEKGALLLETNAELADKVALVINSAVNAGVAWEDIREMVKAETAAGNPVAAAVSRLDLKRNRIWLKLPDLDIQATTAPPVDTTVEASDNITVLKEDNEKEFDGISGKKTTSTAIENGFFDSDDEIPTDKINKTTHATDKNILNNNKRAENVPKYIEVEMDLTLSAYANARKMYIQKKIAYNKEIKTVEAASKVLEQVNNRVQKDMVNQNLKRNLKAVRKIHWFEKFNWCISSEGYLILSGRDAQQNDMLFKRYLRPTDIYVHADIPGAASCIVRAKTSLTVGSTGGGGGSIGATSKQLSAGQSERPISPLAIQEAGVMAVSRSNAWKSKIHGVAAWWVWAHQVTKSAPSGEYLTTGSFMIHGKKNFLPPMPLEMGFGVMFRLDDGSIVRHLQDWKDRSYLSDDRSMSVFTENLDRYAVNFDQLGPDALCLGEDPNNNDDDDTSSVIQDRGHEKDEKEESHIETTLRKNVLEEEAAAEKENISKVILNNKERRKQEKLKRLELKKNNTNKEFPKNIEILDQVEEEDNDEEHEPETETEGTGNSQSEDEEQQQPLNKNNLNILHHNEAPKDNNINNSSTTNNPMNKKDKKKNKQQLLNTTNNTSSKAIKPNKKAGKNKKNMMVDADNDVSDDIEIQSQITASNTNTTNININKKKKLNKKKARRYAEQDDEDKELAMLVLGHTSNKTGEKLNDINDKIAKEKKSVELKIRQEKVGIHIPMLEKKKKARDIGNEEEGNGSHSNSDNLKDDDEEEGLMNILSEEVRTVFENIIYNINHQTNTTTTPATAITTSFHVTDIDIYELKALAGFTPQEGVEILYLFSEGMHAKKISNKSAFLSGIMRRFSSTKQQQQLLQQQQNTKHQIISKENDSNLTEQQQQEEIAEIQAILEEEGINNEEEGKQADEIEKLTGIPLPEDILLYAIPICGPYSSLQNLKYKVKLTPGTGKKGKICKQAIDLFVNSRNCTNNEKLLINNMIDTEMIAIMIGDARLSMPGLHSIQNMKRSNKKNRGQKK